MLGVVAIFITAVDKGCFGTLRLLPRWEERARRESGVPNSELEFVRARGVDSSRFCQIWTSDY